MVGSPQPDTDETAGDRWRPSSLALSPDGGTAAVGIDGGFELVDTRSGAERKVPALTARPRAGCCSARMVTR